MSEFLRIARATLQLEDYVHRMVTLVNRMVGQGGEYIKIDKQFRKAVERHPEAYDKYHTTAQNIINNLTRDGGT